MQLLSRKQIVQVRLSALYFLSFILDMKLQVVYISPLKCNISDDQLHAEQPLCGSAIDNRSQASHPIESKVWNGPDNESE